MYKTLKAMARKTSLYSAYRERSERNKLEKKRTHFWDWTAEDQKRSDFYRQFVDPGDIVFDVGANLGNRAKIFSKLDAVVIAVEPQTACVDFLLSVFRDTDNFHLVKKALGASVGQAEMLISNASVLSSLSPDWIRSVQESGRFRKYEWNQKEMVAIDTLDNLIAEYGRPTFIKIDVEGFEHQVVSGLTTPVKALSMEFTPEIMENTVMCVDRLCQIGDYRFQISLCESMELHLPTWVAADEMKRVLSEIPRGSFGDLYARCDV